MTFSSHPSTPRGQVHDKVVVTTAIAREMVGFIWAIARQVQVQPTA